jgi:1-acyl-sn-glycerol-3-phosphate acyltransferase
MSLSAIPDFSPAFFSLFSRYARWYVGRSFHAVRLSLGGLPPETDSDRPMVIFLNHASWWDPMIAVLLAERFWKSRPHYAPIEAAALEKYRFFRKLGFFPVEKHSPRGARQFLQTSLKILDQPGAILWITPEAQFVDPRRRPTRCLCHWRLNIRFGRSAFRKRSAGLAAPSSLSPPLVPGGMRPKIATRFQFAICNPQFAIPNSPCTRKWRPPRAAPCQERRGELGVAK